MSMVNIKVRRQSFKISCAVGEEAAMRHAAVTVEKKLRRPESNPASQTVNAPPSWLL